MLELLIVVLVVLWLLGYFGPAVIPRIPRTGNFLHVLLVVVVILIIVRRVTQGESTPLSQHRRRQNGQFQP